MIFRKYVYIFPILFFLKNSTAQPGQTFQARQIAGLMQARSGSYGKKFLSNPAFRELKRELAQTKQVSDDYETVYLSIPREFLAKADALEMFNIYLTARGRPNAVPKKVFLADIVKKIGGPLQVEYELENVFLPNEYQLILKRQKVFGPPKRLSADDFEILSKYTINKELLNEFADFLFEYMQKTGLAQNVLVQLSIPKTDIRKYLHARTKKQALFDPVDKVYVPCLWNKLKLIVKDFKARGAPEISLAEQDALDEQYQNWIKTIGNEIVTRTVSGSAIPPRDVIMPQGPPPPVPPRKRPGQLPGMQGPPPPVAPRKRIRFEEPLGRVQIEPAMQPAHMPPPPVPPRRTRIEPYHEEPAPGRQGLLEQIRKGRQLRHVEPEKKMTREEQQRENIMKQMEKKRRFIEAAEEKPQEYKPVVKAYGMIKPTEIVKEIEGVMPEEWEETEEPIEIERRQKREQARIENEARIFAKEAKSTGQSPQEYRSATENSMQNKNIRPALQFGLEALREGLKKQREAQRKVGKEKAEKFREEMRRIKEKEAPEEEEWE